MTTNIDQIIFESLKNIFNTALIIHTIDSANSAMEIDYEKIAKAIIDDLGNNNYFIVEGKDNDGLDRRTN